MFEICVCVHMYKIYVIFFYSIEPAGSSEDFLGEI